MKGPGQQTLSLFWSGDMRTGRVYGKSTPDLDACYSWHVLLVGQDAGDWNDTIGPRYRRSSAT